MGLDLPTDRQPPITGQICYPLCHALFGIQNKTELYYTILFSRLPCLCITSLLTDCAWVHLEVSSRYTPQSYKTMPYQHIIVPHGMK